MTTPIVILNATLIAAVLSTIVGMLTYAIRSS